MAFDYKKELENYKSPKMFKEGLKYYFEVNKIKPKSRAEFKKHVEDYKKIKMGE